ncbi:uncharacterized protein K452DRAFT_338474 [Aplosporella prunicola CBS 121167]|uniref:Uncharacterized protein n=1 Tax=Aplosporella prunicola CBS 121167 TaxID=1176127 RepID=A0A6A6B5C2_9PEZI|nr:uncharacterized protein K452DRAFT_338474 [Aplosporella prunicola CBS 121167]KAF2138424.1 hypothetical protein K452DRAFT_338474 [Aplosporella prunicola CBS 121167]
MDNDSDSHGPSPHPQTARAVATLLVSQSRTSTELPGHANSEEALKHNDTTSYAFWNPIWLGRYVLGTFSILFAALSAAIVVLYCISTSKHGLGTYTKRMEVEYFWKYLPTSVTVLLMAVWGQVDYSTRLLQPWENLRKHTAPANRTIFLDLISPMQPVYWASALRHREWAAAITVTVCIALQIARVFSTGLMTLELTELTSNGLVVSKQAEFDPSALNSSDHGNSAGAIYQSIHTANMSYPDWTFEDYALEPFQPIGSVMKRTAKRYAGEVMAFYPWLDCEKVTLKDKWAHPTSYQTSPYVLDITLQSSSCNASTTITLQRIHGGPGGPKDDTYDYYDGVTELVSCGKSQKYLIVVTHGSSLTGHFSGAICQPNYSLKPLFVKVDNFLQVLTVETRQEKNETDRSFRSSTLDPMDLFQAVLNHSKSVRFPSSSSDNNNGFLKLVSLPTSQGIFEPTAPYMKDLLDTDVLIKQTEATFKGMAVQIAALSLLNPHYKAVNGFVDYEAERLQVKLTSVIAIAICFGLCSILSLFMLCARPWNAAPRDPNSIGGIAAILHSSTQLKSVFKYSLQENKDAFAGQRLIGTIVAETGAYQVSCTGEKDLNQEPSDKKSNTGKKKGWQPLTLNFWSRIATLIVTAAIIIVLEVIQRISNRSHGFTNVASSNLGTAASTYIPTLVMTGVAAMYSSQNFNVVLLSPYRALRTGGSTANRSILSKDLGRLPLFSIFSSAKKGYFASCATAIAAMIGALLTVAVSGLYTLDRVDSPLPISLKRLDRFGTIWDGDVYADNFAGSTLRSIVWQNISYPKWTYGTLAFPSLLIDDVKARERTRLEATLPALRGTLNCTIVDPKEMEYTKQSESSSITLLRLQTLNTCSIGGRMSQLDRTLEDGHVLFHGSDSTRFSTVRDISDGCQSLSFYFGDFSQDTPQISAFTCTQQIQEIDTKVNFLLPDFHIDKSNPPVPDESTIRYVGNEATNGSKTFQYPITYSMSNTFEAVADKADNLSPSLGQFYFAVVYGKYGIPANELIGQANIGRLVNATTEMYSLYMAQLLSLKMRETLNASTAQRLSIEQTIQGKLHGNNLRLVQKARPKLALQIMLAVMFVCGVVSWVSLRTTSLLFHDPCSIAGVATLLAGSQLWGSETRGLLPDGVEWMDDEEMERRGVWKGLVFSLGWWPGGRYGIDVRVPAAASGTSGECR